jgi:hypothetical protein
MEYGKALKINSESIKALRAKAEEDDAEFSRIRKGFLSALPTDFESDLTKAVDDVLGEEAGSEVKSGCVSLSEADPNEDETYRLSISVNGIALTDIQYGHGCGVLPSGIQVDMDSDNRISEIINSLVCLNCQNAYSVRNEAEKLREQADYMESAEKAQSLAKKILAEGKTKPALASAELGHGFSVSVSSDGIGGFLVAVYGGSEFSFERPFNVKTDESVIRYIAGEGSRKLPAPGDPDYSRLLLCACVSEADDAKTSGVFDGPTRKRALSEDVADLEAKSKDAENAASKELSLSSKIKAIAENDISEIMFAISVAKADIPSDSGLNFKLDENSHGQHRRILKDGTMVEVECWSGGGDNVSLRFEKSENADEFSFYCDGSEKSLKDKLFEESKNAREDAEKDAQLCVSLRKEAEAIRIKAAKAAKTLRKAS